MALRGRKPRLSGRGANPPERLANRRAVRAEVPCQIQGLIESAGAPPRRVKGNRDEAVRALKQNLAPAPHQGGQRPGQRAASFVLQRMHDGAKRPIVGARRERAIDETAPAAATRAPRHRHADDAPRRQRIAAAFAEWIGQRPYGLPAAVADRSARRAIEELAAGRAGRREDD